MNKDNLFYATIAVVCIVVLGLIGWGVFTLDAKAQLREEFEAVCTYEGGTVEGDVCIKDSRVILDKSSFK